MLRFLTMARSRALVVCLLLCVCFLPTSYGQNTQGTVSVVAIDSTGGLVQGADLTLVDLATNDTRKATTQEAGNYRFVGLNFGKYKLTVEKVGFQKQEYEIEVQVGRVVDIKAELKVASVGAVVEVKSVAPLVEASSSATSMTVDTRQIENLPLAGRDISALTRLTAGYTGDQNGGTWNGLPVMAQGNNFDGVVGNTSRMKFRSPISSPIVSPRIENIAEMTAQTDQLDLDQGFGQSNMQINFVTRRGTNNFHGRLYEDHRNSALNAAPWNYAPGQKKPALILNEFGGSVGGPILRDKLFFFGSFSISKQPGAYATDNQMITQAAQQGLFSYVDSEGATQTVDLFGLAAAYNEAHGTTLPTTVNSTIQEEFTNINGWVQGGTLDPGAANSPNLAFVRWNQQSPTTRYYPTFRVDYLPKQSVRVNFAYNQTWMNQLGVNAAFFPNTQTATANKSTYSTSALGVEWTISPTLVNQFRGGYLHNTVWNSYNPPKYDETSQIINWNYANVDWPYGGNMSGQQFYLPITTRYPVFNFSDNLIWQKGKHGFSMGFSWFREQDHYQNAPEGITAYDMGLATGDPALNAFTTASFPGISDSNFAEAKQLYAILTGRLSHIGAQHAYDVKAQDYLKTLGHYDLNELQKAWGLFFQDSFHVKPNLTLNYGLRWDFTGDNHDLTGFYHSARPTDVYGPSGIGNLFMPGTLSGNMDPTLQAMAHQYKPWNVSPQPAIGIAWSPHASSGFLHKLTGDDALVVRAGYSLRRFTEPQQYFWNMATDFGSFYYQKFDLYPNAEADGETPGIYQPGSLSLGYNPSSAPPYAYTPAQYMATESVSDFTWTYAVPVAGLDPKIPQPYTQSWNLGIQRQLGQSRALEIRYNGNRTLHQWITNNLNEVNIFENGFLDEFQKAQANLATYIAANPSCVDDGNCNFGNTIEGQSALPILEAAFGGSGSGQFANQDFVNMLNNGQVGTLANTLTRSDFFCNLVGTSFVPCANSGAGAGAGYPINFFQANPFASNQGALYMNAGGYSTYNGLQVDLRQRAWHGIQFDANYTWSHTLGVAEHLDWIAVFPQYTNRNPRLNYAPTGYDLRHVVNVNASYDLPFGKGKQFLNSSSALDKVVGGWTVSTIYSFKTGAPIRLTGGMSTFNFMPGVGATGDVAEGGVNLDGISVSQLQNLIGVYHPSAGSTYILPSDQVAHLKTLATPNTTAGTMGQIVYLHAPHQTFDDIAITKEIGITERFRFKFQAEMLNAFNHPVFNASGGGSQNVGSGTFGRGGYVNNGYMGLVAPRRIEFRANFEF